MTQLVLPRMVEEKKGVIVNVSSGGGLDVGILYASVYSGTKVRSEAKRIACYVAEHNYYKLYV